MNLISKSGWRILCNLKLRVLDLHLPVLRRLSKWAFEELSCFWKIHPWICYASELRNYRCSVRIKCSTFISSPFSCISIFLWEVPGIQYTYYAELGKNIACKPIILVYERMLEKWRYCKISPQKWIKSPWKSPCWKSEFHPVSSKRRHGCNDLVSIMTENHWILNGSSELEKSITVKCLLGWNWNLRKIKSRPIYKLSSESD